ncbi:hypothetical protein ABGT15_12080 [Flavobacterium enshiense]|uniref:hypothetical protein n=1 Tax=Flavobacterium enshiense TaxID=1341165 RepID=UPI00345DCB72
MRRVKALILSWDFFATVFVTAIAYFIMPGYIDMKFLLSVYNMSITILALIFSLFFAALAIIMSSSENDFIDFLDEENLFTELLWSFKVTLIFLFFSLIYSIILYTGTSYYIETYSSKEWLQDNILFLILVALFTYSMAATCISVYDTIKFSEYRSKFNRMKKK